MTRKSRKDLLGYNASVCIAALCMALFVAFEPVPKSTQMMYDGARAKIGGSQDLVELKRHAFSGLDYITSLEKLVRTLRGLAIGIAAGAAISAGFTTWRVYRESAD